LNLRTLALLLGAAASLTALAACGDDDGGTGTTSTARVRVVQAVADAPAVNVLLDGTAPPGGSNVAYKGVVGYARVDAGAHNVRIDNASTGAALLETALTVAAATDYTVYAIGQAGNGTVAPLTTLDDNRAPGSNQAKIRIVHVSPTAGPVDVYVTPPGAPLTDVGRVFSGVAYADEANGTRYLSLPAGRYQVRVTNAGTTAVGIDAGSKDLGRGQIRTFVLVGGGSLGAPYELLTLSDR
jgi:hypothetical protein